MPTYDYFCEIHKEFEIEHSMNEEITECPLCKKEGVSSTVKKLISLSTFHLKGGGWANENYK